MKLTFSKTLLTATVMLGLTACGSGSSGSNAPTTAPNKNPVTVPSNPSTKPENNNQTAPNTNSSNTNTGNSLSSQQGSDINETINIPTVKNPTENTPKEMVWGVLPKIPKIETSTVSGHGTDLKGKATYLYNSGFGNSFTYESNNIIDHDVSQNDGKSYVVLNADFDNKKISGSAAFNLYGSNPSYSTSYDDIKKQVELTFKDTSLYKGENNLVFNGEATGRFISKDLKVEELSGSYSGDISPSGGSSFFGYTVYTPDKNITIRDSGTLYKQ